MGKDLGFGLLGHKLNSKKDNTSRGRGTGWAGWAFAHPVFSKSTYRWSFARPVFSKSNYTLPAQFLAPSAAPDQYHIHMLRLCENVFP